MKTLAKIIGYGLVVLLLAAVVGFTYKYTNGFNEDLKTFYIECNGRQILTKENEMTFNQKALYRFYVKYTFDKEDSEPKGYKVKIVPNVSKNFDYTVDGENYLFSKVGDITSVFEPIMYDTFFELYFSDSLNFSEILKKAHNGKSISVPTDALTNNPYPFQLQISSYSGKVTYNINFTIDTMGTGQTSGGNTANTTQPNNPTVPNEPYKPTKSYSISSRVVGNENNLLMADVICPETSVAGETVQFAVSLIGDYKSEVTKIAVYSGGKLFSNIAVSGDSGSSNYYNTFTFTMPEGNAEIVVTIKAIVVSEYRSISFDTLGSGSVDSINVYCADVAKPGDYVMASIYLTWDEQDTLEITRVVLTNADTGDELQELEQFNEFFDFTMPDCDVVIMVYLMPV